MTHSTSRLSNNGRSIYSHIAISLISIEQAYARVNKELNEC